MHTLDMSVRGKKFLQPWHFLVDSSLFKPLKKHKKKKLTTCCVGRKHYLNAHFFLYINNIIEQKRLEIKEVPKKETWLNKSKETVNEKKLDIYMKKKKKTLFLSQTHVEQVQLQWTPGT